VCIYIYIYICARARARAHTHTHTHTQRTQTVWPTKTRQLMLFADRKVACIENDIIHWTDKMRTFQSYNCWFMWQHTGFRQDKRHIFVQSLYISCVSTSVRCSVLLVAVAVSIILRLRTKFPSLSQWRLLILMCHSIPLTITARRQSDLKAALLMQDVWILT
jgi:hypothetical protein